MSRIFLSHSSKDDFAAVGILGWLNENGWDDVFLDLDAAEGIQPGERWERSLYEHAARCEAVLFLISRNWLASDWCRREYELARKLNKRIFVVLIDELTIPELPSYLTGTQAVSLAAGEDHVVRPVVLPTTQQEGHVTFSAEGLARLKAGLAQAGLDPRFFAWPPANDPDRAPYRGLEPLEAADAGIFFGRDAPVIEALDLLRGLREGACPRLFVLLGASGAGKSSFLRAGLLPRLARDDRNFFPLPVIRPGRSVVTGITGFVAALAAACDAQGTAATRVQLREAAVKGADALRPYLQDLASRVASASAAPKKPPTLVIAVDQAEELFRAEGAHEGETLLSLFRDLVQGDTPALIVLFAIRSDSYDALEHAKPLEGLSPKTFPLLPMPRGAYQTVIEGPAERFQRAGHKFEIDPSLTEALLADLEKGGGSDVLPLLAFTLEQLFYDNKAAGRLSKVEYEKFGGLKGAVDAALARVFAEADKDPRIPRAPDARLALLRRGLIPWLAGIDPDTRTPRRRRAAASQIPEEARPLTDLLVEQRLLTRAVDEITHLVTVEPAHEALLRQWGSLKGWLEEDFAKLVTLEGVKRAARDWEANARDVAWAAHGGGRLQEAVRLDTRPDLAALLDQTDRAYLAACAQKQSESLANEQARAAAERRAAQRTRIGLAVSSALLVVAIAAAVYGFSQAKLARVSQANAERETVKAEQRSAVLAASASQSLTAEGSLDQALLLMLDAARVFDDASVPDQIRIALTKALQKRERVETRNLFPNVQAFDTPDALVLIDPATNDIWRLTNSIDPKRIVAGSPNDSKVVKLGAGAGGKQYIVLRENLDVEGIDTATGARKKLGAFSQPKGRPGRSYDYDDVRMTNDGLVVRNFFASGAGDPSNYFQAMNPETGAVIEGDLAGSAVVMRKRPGGGVYAFDGYKNQVLEVTAAANGLLVKPASLSDQDGLAVRYGDCIAKMSGAIKQKVLADLKTNLMPGGTSDCSKVGGDYLIEEVNSGSAGLIRSDALFQSNGKQIDLRNTVKALAAGALSGNNFAWAGGFPLSETLAAKLKTKSLAVLLNRDAYVMSKPDGTDDWSLLLNFRHPAAVAVARFIDPERLVVVNAESGQLFEHKFGGEPNKKLLPTSLDNIIGSKTPISTLHQGTCVGYAMPRTGKATMPDGRQIIFETGSTTNSSEKHQIRVPGASEMVIALGDDAACIQFSADWKRMLVVRENNVVLYDFSAVLQRGAIAGSEIGALPVRTTTALFAGPTGEKVVTTDLSTHVHRWSHRVDDDKWVKKEVYEGDNPVVYAEPDASGERIIIIEDVGGSEVHGLFYSVAASEIWYDLGSDYKELGTALTPNSEIAVSEHSQWKRTYPVAPLSRLVEIADAQLSPDCRPPQPKQYRQSPCWPR